PPRRSSDLAETVGEKQFGYAEAAIGRGHVEDALPVQLRADDHVVLQVNASLWKAGATGGIEPERRIILARRLSLEFRRRLRHQFVERRSDDNDVLEV